MTDDQQKALTALKALAVEYRELELKENWLLKINGKNSKIMEAHKKCGEMELLMYMKVADYIGKFDPNSWEHFIETISSSQTAVYIELM